MSVHQVALVAVDDQVLVDLLAVAVREASPVEVMAPVAGPPGWTVARRAAFTEYHRRRRAAGEAEPRSAATFAEVTFAEVTFAEVTFAVTADGEVVGAARLAAVDDDSTALEIGLWLGRRSRGKGIAGAVLPVAAEVARGLGANRLIARTSSVNGAAVAVLRSHGFSLISDSAGHVEAALSLADAQDL